MKKTHIILKRRNKPEWIFEWNGDSSLYEYLSKKRCRYVIYAALETYGTYRIYKDTGNGYFSLAKDISPEKLIFANGDSYFFAKKK